MVVQQVVHRNPSMLEVLYLSQLLILQNFRLISSHPRSISKVEE